MLARAPAQTGEVLWMKEPYSEEVATHTGPESCIVVRKGGSEALTGVRAGRVMSHEINAPLRWEIQGADAVSECGRQHRVYRNREVHSDPAWSKTPGMYGNTLRGSREILRLSVDRGAAGRIEKSKDIRR